MSFEIARAKWIESFDVGQLTWDRVKGRKLYNDITEQEFWTGSANQKSETTLLSERELVDIVHWGRYHIAHLPWEFPDGEPGKKSWTKEEWEHFSDVFKSCLLHANNIDNAIKYLKGITISLDILRSIDHSILNSFHIVNINESISTLKTNKLDRLKWDNVLFDCDLEVSSQVATFVSCYVRKMSAAVNYSLYVHECNFFSISFIGIGDYLEIHGGFVQNVSLEQGVGELVIGGDATIINIYASRVTIKKLNISYCAIENISIIYSVIENEFRMGRSTVGCITHKIQNNLKEYYVPSFYNTIFRGVIEFDMNNSFLLSSFSGAQFLSPINIDQNTLGGVESVFEREIGAIAKLDKKNAERRLSHLENACQLIGERYRQDGRRNLETRFKRMEIMTRSRKKDGDPWVKLINWVYATCSNYGFSIARPILLLFFAIISFSVVYSLLGGSGAGAKFIGSGVDWSIWEDGFRLGIDTAFPFGSSVDLDDLFLGKIYGNRPNYFAIIIDGLRIVQGLFSTVMLFLSALAIRTRLMIG